MSRDEDDGTPRIQLVNLLEYIQAGTVGQLKIEDDHIRRSLAHHLQALGGGARREHRHAVALEDPAKRVADALLVVNDQQRRHDALLRRPPPLAPFLLLRRRPRPGPAAGLWARRWRPEG